MTPKEFTDLWGQYTSGADVSGEDVPAMERLLESDTALRTEVADDHQLHRMLQSMGTIHESQDEFVGGVLAACIGVDDPFAPLLHAEPDPAPRKLSRLAVVGCVGVVVAGLLLAAGMSIRLSRTRAQADLAMRLATEAQHRAELAEQISKQQARSEQLRGALPAVDAEQSATEPEDSDEAAHFLAVISGDESESVWRGNIVGQRMAAGEFELLSGQSILKLSGGSVVSFNGPARFELHHAAHLSLHEGEVEVQVAPDDLGFRVTTSNTRIIDLGTRFRVAVNDQGRTRVTLDSGEVVVVPWRSGRGGSRFHLRVGEQEEAVVHSPADDSDGLEASYANGPAGFRGSVRLDELSFELTSLERFNCVFDGISSNLRSDPEQTKSDWLRARTVLSRVTGSLSRDDDQVQINDLDSLLRAEERLSAAADQTQSAGAVTGAFVVAGKPHPFRSRAEYEKVRARVLGSLDALGIRSFSKMRQQQDLKTNPFRP